MGKKTIAFVGLGIMGMPMARHLMNAGHRVIGHNRSQGKMDTFAAHGGETAATCGEAAAQADIVISIVPDSPDVEKVYLANDGVLQAARAGTLLIDMSTISPVTARHVAEAALTKQCPMLDAPVSGGQVGAQNAKLSIMVGGTEEDYKQALPILQILGTPTYCGPSGAGQTVKACNQVQVAMNFIGMAEALVLGASAGVAPETIIKVLSGGYAQTRVMDVRGPEIAQGNFEPGFKARFHYKDLNIVRETARAFGACLPASNLAHELFTAMLSNGWGDLDHSAVVKVIEQLSGIELDTTD